jgi:hypothetical protein
MQPTARRLSSLPLGAGLAKHSSGKRMKRIHLFEFTDLSWYPNTLRHIQTDYLQFVATLGTGHKSLVPLFKQALQSAKTNEIVDLCSGGTGPWIHLAEQLEQAGLSINITLTDKYPNPESIQKWSATSQQRIKYLAEPIDAMNVPESLTGMRTLFEGFHHFKPDQAKSILQDAVKKRAAIGIFEASLKPPFGIVLLLLSPLITIVSYIFMTPFIKPRTCTRFFWTYLIPVVPLVTTWDGIVSLLRTYSLQELKELTGSCPSKDYTWEIGTASTGTPIFTFSYLVGYPVEESQHL